MAPHVLARHLVDRGAPVRWHELPVPLPGLEVEQRWHSRLDGAPPARWLRDHVAAALDGLADEEPRSPSGRTPPA